MYQSTRSLNLLDLQQHGINADNNWHPSPLPYLNAPPFLLASIELMRFSLGCADIAVNTGRFLPKFMKTTREQCTCPLCHSRIA